LYLRNRFGDAFERLDENGRLAVATAQIEGFVTNGRMQQLCRLHPRDLTILLKKLGDDGFLLHDGQGRGTTYRIAGIQATDLADSVDLANPMANSAHLETSSAHLETSSAHLASTPLTDARLQTIALPVALTSKAPPELIESTIIELCRVLSYVEGISLHSTR
jgi:ATP-dependent DNA helicase RecG